MNAAIYCRVSTDNQEREGTSLQTQLENCFTYCQGKGYEVSFRFSETYSGLSLERPELDKLRELVRTEAIDVVACYSLDRLTRDPGHGVIITQELEKHHVTLEAVTEDVDNSELGKLISYIRGFASKLEAEKIRERTMRGKAQYVKTGKLPIGTGKGLYGYKWDDKNKKRIPLECEVRVVEKAFLMRANHEKTFKIARTLNEQEILTKTGGKWHPRTIHRMLTNPAYIGRTYYGKTRGSRKTKLVERPESEWILLPDITPPIISQGLFDRVQEIIRQDSELHRAMAKQDYVLRGHVICGYCGSPLAGSYMNHRFRYYHCRGTYPTATREKKCSARYIRADYLEDVTWQNIKEVLSRPEIVLASVSEQLELEQNVPGTTLAKEIQKLKQRLKSYETQEKQLIQLLRYEEVTPDAVLDEINQLKKDRESDKQKLGSYVLTKERIASLENAELKLKDYCRQLHKDLDNATFQEKRDILEMLAIKVTATPEQVEIQGVILLDTTATQTPDRSPYLLTTGQTSA
jgi:site-specific DNA recombinase